MSRSKAWSRSLRVVAGLSAALLTIAAVLYAPIGLDTQSPAGMALLTHLVLAVVVVSAAGTWILAFRPDSRTARLVSSMAGGFNGIWIFSFVGLPVVVASLFAIFVSAVGAPRRLAIAVVALAMAGFGVGLVVLQLTQHFFG